MNLPTRTYGYADILRLPLRSAPVATTLFLVLRVAEGLLPTLSVLFTARFLDAAIAFLGGASFSAALPPAVLMAVSVGLTWIVSQLFGLLKVYITNGGRERYRTALLARRAALHYEHVENPESWDLVSRVCKDADVEMTNALDELTQLPTFILRVGGLLLLLTTQVWWAGLLTIALAVPIMLIAKRGGEADYQVERDTARLRRKYEYLSEVLTNREAAMERALFGFGRTVDESYNDSFVQAYRHRFQVRKRWFIKSKAIGVAFGLLSVVMALSLLPSTLAGETSPGTFMALFGAISGMIPMISWSLTGMMQNLAKRREGMRDLTKMLALSTQEGALDAPASPVPAFRKLELRDVRFAYPGTDKTVLDGMSLTIEAGRHYAFVGGNGAGKTTVTKLLLGLYDNYEGEILIDGRDIRKLSQAEKKALFSIVYQDFAQYSISVTDNITFDRPERQARLAEAAEAVGLREIESSLPNGMQTRLGKIDGEGVDLSGGQWQRIAMARAAASPAPVRILDEPTAALDPISESRVYEDFERISRGTTTLFISHRLGSTQLADTIYVLEDGKVAEEGTHDELMAAHGLYAEMYASQRSWYE